MLPGTKILMHLAALLTVAVWGITFISTKILLTSGFAATYIFEIRFLIAYLLMLVLSLWKKERSLLCASVQEEAQMFLCGICGGSLYFIMENTALSHTQACNVSFIVCTAPLFTTIFTILSNRFMSRFGFTDDLEKTEFSKKLVIATILSLSGMAMVIFDGSKGLSFSMSGDLLSLCAALLWAVYSLFISSLIKKYGSLFTTRKVFFYGILTALPFLDFSQMPALSMFTPNAVAHLLFLSIVASFACFTVWNAVLRSLGNVTCSNYIYLIPILTLITAIIYLGEKLSVTAAIGCAAILGGVVLAGLKPEQSDT